MADVFIHPAYAFSPTTLATLGALSSIASTTSGTEPNFFDALLSSLKSRITQWLADASNGIHQFFADIGNFHTVNTDQLCVEGTCVTGSQLAALLASAGQSPAASSSGPSAPAASDNATTTPPMISIDGNNPATISVGDTYNDLGATITGPASDLNLGIKTYLNGALVSDIVLDTSTTTTDIIDYVATDQNGFTSTSTRTVLIEPRRSYPQLRR